MFAVPRVFERFAARIRDGVAGSPWKRGLLERCVVAGARVELGGATLVDRLATPLLRALVARPILDRFGGRLRLAVVGGAAMDPAIARSLHRARPAGAAGVRHDRGLAGRVGQPPRRQRSGDGGPAARQRRGAPGRGGRAAGARRRASCSATGTTRPRPRASSTATRWLHTGDVAEFERGHIAIRGRLKDILVLSNGEKLPPQDAELAILGDGTLRAADAGRRRAAVSDPARRREGRRREGSSSSAPTTGSRTFRATCACGARS